MGYTGCVKRWLRNTILNALLINETDGGRSDGMHSCYVDLTNSDARACAGTMKSNDNSAYERDRC